MIFNKEYQSLRLDEKTRIIKNEVAKQLGNSDVVRLFGSRVDDTLRGDDIDLFIELSEPIDSRIRVECELAARLFIKLGCKVNVLIKDP